MPTNTRSTQKKQKSSSTELSNSSKTGDSLCKECSEKISKRDKKIVCATCSSPFHIDCKLIPRKKLQSMKDSNTKWHCSSECKRFVIPTENVLDKFNDDGIIDKSEDETDDDEEINISQIGILVDDISKDSSVKNILMSIVESQKFLANKMDQILTENNALKKIIQTYKKINQDLCDNVETLSEEVNLLKQEKFERNLIMMGIPQESDTENLINTILLTTKKIGSKLNETDIVEAKRLGNASIKIGNHQKTRTPPILIKFKNTSIKKEVLAKKNEYGDLLAKSIFNNAVERHRIFINNYMTPYNIDLLKKASDLKKNYGYSYVWFGGNNVWAKKNADNNSLPIKITSINTIRRLKQTNNSPK